MLDEQTLWLTRAVHEHLKPYVEHKGLPFPTCCTIRAVRISPVEGRIILGRCIPADIGQGRPVGIEIENQRRDPVEVLGTLLYEIIHAADTRRSGHGDWFTAWARHLGLAGASASTHPGPGLRCCLQRIVAAMPPYPSLNRRLTAYADGRVLP